MTPIRGLFFDLDGTLFDRAPILRRFTDEALQRYREAFPHVADSPSEAIGSLLADESGSLTFDRLVFCRKLADLLRGPSWTPQSLASAYSEWVLRLLTDVPSPRAILESLRDRHALALITNGTRHGQRKKLNALDLDSLFSTVVISGEVGARKPSARPFRLALDRTGCRPEEVVFIGDEPECDIQGASAVGMKTCWIARGRSYPEGFPRPDFTIDRLEDLASVLS